VASGPRLRWVGQDGLFRPTPRVRYEVDYRERPWFGQNVEIENAIARLRGKFHRSERIQRRGGREHVGRVRGN
jgi:acyl-CoA thioester hydrolase